MGCQIKILFDNQSIYHNSLKKKFFEKNELQKSLLAFRSASKERYGSVVHLFSSHCNGAGRLHSQC